MQQLKDLKEDRFAVAMALLGYTQSEAAKWAGYPVETYTKAALRSYASKIARRTRVAERIQYLSSPKSNDTPSDNSLITAERVLLKASDMVEQSKTVAEFTKATELYLKLRKDVESAIQARVPQEAEQGGIGSVEFSKRLNVGLQLVDAELRAAVGLGESVPQSPPDFHESLISTGGEPPAVSDE